MVQYGKKWLTSKVASFIENTQEINTILVHFVHNQRERKEFKLSESFSFQTY